MAKKLLWQLVLIFGTYVFLLHIKFIQVYRHKITYRSANIPYTEASNAAMLLTFHFNY